MQALSDTPGYHTRKDETGNRYGRLVVVSFDRVDRNGNARWTCHCDCGHDVVVLGASLRRGITQSCGCYRNDVISEVQTKRWNEYRSRLIHALFTDGLYPQGKPTKEKEQ